MGNNTIAIIAHRFMVNEFSRIRRERVSRIPSNSIIALNTVVLVYRER